MTIAFTLLTSDHCSLTKEFHLVEGRIQSTTIANMASGTTQRIEVPDVSALQLGLSMLLPNQAICCGLNIYGDTPLTTGRKAAGDPGLVARTTDYFAWPQGPALFAIDVDVEEGSEYRSVEAVLNALESCSDWLKDTLRIAKPSSSSYVGGRGLRGVHVYLAVTEGTRIPELGKRLQQDQWLAGKGFIKISKSGALLVRQLSDASIYQTQRILFEATPLLGEGVTRDIPAGQGWVVRARQIAPGRPPLHTENGMLNVAKLAPLKALYVRQYETAVAGAKQRAKAQANSAAFDWHKARAEALGWPEEVAERLATAAIAARDKKQLALDSYLTFEVHGPQNVAQVLENWELFAGEFCTPPDDALRGDLEPRHYTKAVVTTREGKRGVFSFKDNEFYAFQPKNTPKLDKWMQAALRLDGAIEYPEPMGRGTTPPINTQTALLALVQEAGFHVRYNKATFSVEGLPYYELAGAMRALSRVGCHGLKEESYKQACTWVAAENAYDPWRETVDALPSWDLIPRLDGLLAELCGAPDCEALTRTSQALFAAIVMRQLHPGVAQGVIPVLIGDQGVGKSYRFVKALATALGCPGVPQIEFKESERMSRDARTAWIAELAEMSGHGKKDAEAVKMWATNGDDIYKDLYDRDSTPHPRRFVLIGTANKHELNNDETGNRRFMPVRVTQPISATWTLELPQILAEARDRFCLDEEAYGSLCAAASQAVLAHNTADMRRGEGSIHDTIDDLLPGILNRLSKAGPTVHAVGIRTALDALPSGRTVSSHKVGRWMQSRGWQRTRVGQGYVYTPPIDYTPDDNEESLTQAINPFAVESDAATVH